MDAALQRVRNGAIALAKVAGRISGTRNLSPSSTRLGNHGQNAQTLCPLSFSHTHTHLTLTRFKRQTQPQAHRMGVFRSLSVSQFCSKWGVLSFFFFVRFLLSDLRNVCPEAFAIILPQSTPIAMNFYRCRSRAGGNLVATILSSNIRATSTSFFSFFLLHFSEDYFASIELPQEKSF